MAIRWCPGCSQYKGFDELKKGQDFYTRKYVWREGDYDDGVVRERFTVRLIASGYCRACANRKRSESRRRAKVRDLVCRAADDSLDTGLVLQVIGACDACGHLGKRDYVGYPVLGGLACWACRALLGDPKDRKERLLEMLRVLLAHNTGRYLATPKPKVIHRRERIGGDWEEWDEPGPPGTHKFGTITEHAVCLEMEYRVRNLLRRTLGRAA